MLTIQWRGVTYNLSTQATPRGFELAEHIGGGLARVTYHKSRLGLLKAIPGFLEAAAVAGVNVRDWL